jgi:hypothetical protein
MRIPTNSTFIKEIYSTFTKEISKQFKRIFHKDMTLGGLQDLQEEVNLINPVDSYLENQVTQIRKANATKTNVQDARAVRQSNSRKKFVEKLFKVNRRKKSWLLNFII